jgi:hypothetical protein
MGGSMDYIVIGADLESEHDRDIVQDALDKAGDLKVGDVYYAIGATVRRRWDGRLITQVTPAGERHRHNSDTN